MSESKSGRRHRAVALALLLGGCATQPPLSGPGGAPEASLGALACTLPTNCADSLGDADPGPLRYAGTSLEAMATLEATVGTFAEATVVRREPLLLETIFTTLAGFRDRVEFRIDPAAQRIDFRSRSTFGLFDFGKNRSRMREVAERFEQQKRR